MKQRFWICGVVFGALLLGLAATLILAADHSGGMIDASQRLRLERAVSQLDGCLTCHESPDAADTAQGTLVAAPVEYDYLAYATGTTDVTDPKSDRALSDTQMVASLRIEMLSIGQRILDLPVTGAAQAEQIDALTAGFLAVHDVALTAQTPDDLGSTLDTLATLEAQVRTLEHQAHPAKLAAAAASDSMPQTRDALLAAPQVPLPAAWDGKPADVVQVAARAERVEGQRSIDAAFVMTYDVRRRGPPAAFDNSIDSFG